MPEGYENRRVGAAWGGFHQSLPMSLRIFNRRWTKLTGPYQHTRPDGTWSNSMSVSAIRAALLQEFDRNRDIGFRVRVRGTPTTQSQYVLRRFLHSLGPDILTAALSQIGVPYIWADEDPKGGGSAGFDCSGLVKWAYSQVGILLPHQSEQMRAVMTPCPVASVRPGDVLHYDFDQPGVSSHVALFLDGQSGGRVVDTESPQRPVAIRTFAQVVRPPFAASYNEYVTGKH